jgi:endonuclease YncB( thermonuclease family)
MKRTSNLATLILSALFGLTFALAGCMPARGVSQAEPPPTTTRPPRTPLPSLDTATPSTNVVPQGESARVTRVFDGDTIEVEMDGRTYRLRYIGVDSPERDEPFYEDALDFNRDMVEDDTVTLVHDVSETDQYGRLLRYVYLSDGTFVNAALISNGMARLVTFPPDVAQTDYLRHLQSEAKDEGVGMWSRPDLTGPCDCDRNLYDCRDFQSRDEAQTCFEYCLDTSGRDVHNLDGGGDGLVCEFLP